ncbi:unnamed protein product [Toxocara canis]|uniref:Chloride channel protein n=1 Tax=Toxocara canis TaxID=6265 RepID=A0A183U1D6_TOXCA|nr:unnamed protein product [Toxocara canis]
MPMVTRTTVTTTRTTSGFRSSTIPVWVIKLLTVVIALVVLLLMYMQDKAVRAGYSTTFIVIALTCGILLGWSIGSVLQQVFFIRTVAKYRCCAISNFLPGIPPGTVAFSLVERGSL